MARQNHGPLSRAKGKLGGVVYQQYEGMQISREYQPNVKNPQSESQVNNRADFKLASQAVAMFKEVINARLGKLSIYTRTRRGAAVAALKRVITNGGTDSRELKLNDAIAALNAKSMTEYAAPTVTVGSGAINVTAPGQSIILGIIAGFDSHLKYIGRKIVSTTSTGSAVEFAIPSDYTHVKAMFVYTLATEEAGRATYSNIQDPDAALTLDFARMISEGDVEISDIAGASASA